MPTRVPPLVQGNSAPNYAYTSHARSENEADDDTPSCQIVSPAQNHEMSPMLMSTARTVRSTQEVVRIVHLPEKIVESTPILTSCWPQYWPSQQPQ